MLAKGLPEDNHMRRIVANNARQSLMRMAQRGRVRRILDEPDMWWELVG
jgi:DNA-binding TFAR19-related protein (PDSD5 family)